MSSTAQEATNQMRDAVLFAAGPRSWDDTRDSWLARGAARLGIPFQRAYALFYRRVTNPSAAEFIEITRRHQQLQQQRARQESTHAAHEAAIAALAGPQSTGGQRVGTAAEDRSSRPDLEG